MDYQLTDAYKRLIETRDALERLHNELCGSWPLEHETADDIAARIKLAVNRQRQQADAGQRALFEGEVTA